jgi:DNA-binding transcriptional MerR regulator
VKTGEAAKILGVDPKTIRNWIDDYGLDPFFSSSALGKDGTIQRMLTEGDLLVLNTIRAKKAHGTTDWADIGAYLESGKRETEFPQNAISADTRTISVEQAQQSARALATMSERDAALARIDELNNELQVLREDVRRLQKEKEEQREGHYREMMELSRQMGKLEGQLEFYRNNANSKAGTE